MRRMPVATLLTVVVTLALPLSPLGPLFGLGRLPIPFLALVAIIVAAYIVTAELVKTIFYKKVKL